MTIGINTYAFTLYTPKINTPLKCAIKHITIAYISKLLKLLLFSKT